MTILKVNSNLTHNGEVFPVGKVFEAEQGEFQSLINDGVLSVVEGADTIDEATEVVKQQAEAQAQADAEPAVEASPQDTWGPAPEQPVVPADQSAPVNTEETQPVDGNIASSQPVVPSSDITGEEL